MVGIVFLVLNTLFLHSVSGFSNGAPVEVCESMTPNPTAHGAQPQVILSPFRVVTDKSYYEPGEPVSVTIQSSGNDRFKGLLVQARELGKTAAIGSFSDSLPSGVKHLACSNSKGGVTHLATRNWDSIVLEWFPPTDVSEIANISLLATVVKDKATFWVKLQSMPLYNKIVSTTTMILFPRPNEGRGQMNITMMKSTPCPAGKCSAYAFSPNTFLFLFIVTIISAYTVRL